MGIYIKTFSKVLTHAIFLFFKLPFPSLRGSQLSEHRAILLNMASGVGSFLVQALYLIFLFLFVFVWNTQTHTHIMCVCVIY